jgi:hypothetical protein
MLLQLWVLQAYFPYLYLHVFSMSVVQTRPQLFPKTSRNPFNCHMPRHSPTRPQ